MVENMCRRCDGSFDDTDTAVGSKRPCEGGYCSGCCNDKHCAMDPCSGCGLEYYTIHSRNANGYCEACEDKRRPT
jgi:hypothetical protein